MKNDNWNVGELLGLSGSYWKACTLHAGVRLDVFTLIGDEAVGADEVARRLSANAEGVTRLLNALTAMRLLTKQQDQYVNTPESKSLLVKDSK